jgi:CheY-like chemotaxis protein
MALPAVLLLDEERGESPPPVLRAVPSEGLRREPGLDDPRSARGVVLVADDDDPLRETVAEILSGEGYTVLQAENGEKALEVLRHHDVDVLVLDLAMPRLDGLAVLTSLGARRPKVILYSAFEYFTFEQLDQMGVRQEVFRLLRKPVPPPALLDAVAEALAQ